MSLRVFPSWVLLQFYKQGFWKCSWRDPCLNPISPHMCIYDWDAGWNFKMVSTGSVTDRECHTLVGPILKLAYLKENKLFLSTKACKHLQLFDSGPILSVILPYTALLPVSKTTIPVHKITNNFKNHMKREKLALKHSSFDINFLQENRGKQKVFFHNY